MNGDTDDTIYTIAFKDGLFLMVWNPKRKGWEMPGGHVKTGETRIEGAKREFEEESGWTVTSKRSATSVIAAYVQASSETAYPPTTR